MTTKRGQSIVEVVIATALISVGIIAALSLANYAQKQSNTAKSVGEANRYNAQVADWLREQKNLLGWANISNIALRDDTSNHAKYCLSDLPHPPFDFTSLTPGACAADDYISGTTFVRELDIDTSQENSGTLTFKITSTWQEKTAHTITSELKLLE